MSFVKVLWQAHCRPPHKSHRHLPCKGHRHSLHRGTLLRVACALFVNRLRLSTSTPFHEWDILALHVIHQLRVVHLTCLFLYCTLLTGIVLYFNNRNSISLERTVHVHVKLLIALLLMRGLLQVVHHCPLPTIVLHLHTCISVIFV